MEFWDDANEVFTRTIIYQGMKLIVKENNNFELYDLESDSKESHNLVSAFPLKVKELNKKLKSLINSFKYLKPCIDKRKVK